MIDLHVEDVLDFQLEVLDLDRCSAGGILNSVYMPEDHPWPASDFLLVSEQRLERTPPYFS